MQNKKLIIVRHGNYIGLQLTLDGREQIKSISKKLKVHTDGKNVCIISSTEERAEESAEIISKNLGILSFERFEALVSAGGSFVDGQEDIVIGRVNHLLGHYDIVIMVTHLEFIEDFPKIWGSNLETRINFHRWNDSSRGDARILTLPEGSDEIIHP